MQCTAEICPLAVRAVVRQEKEDVGRLEEEPMTQKSEKRAGCYRESLGSQAFIRQHASSF